MTLTNLFPLVFGLAVNGGMVAQPPAAPPTTVLYSGMCEASAAVALGSGTFVVADDDKKDLRVYREGSPAMLQVLEISSTVPDLTEKADLEGAARIDQDIYWIGSHSRKKNGDDRPGGRRLFAIRVEPRDGKLSVQPVGKPYKTLLADLQSDSRFDKYELGKAAALKPEETGGLNIEGLAATPDGKLLIGFRNPIRDGKALIFPLDNPRQVLDGGKATFGTPAELDLGNRGIRSLEYWPAGEAYLIIAGSIDGAGSFQPYLWSGKPGEAAKALEGLDLAGMVPEAVFFDPKAPNKLFVLSDDGDACPSPEAFRGRWLALPKG